MYMSCSCGVELWNFIVKKNWNIFNALIYKMEFVSLLILSIPHLYGEDWKRNRRKWQIKLTHANVNLNSSLF